MGINVSFHLNKSSRYKEAKSLAVIGRITYSFLDKQGLQKRQFKFATGESCLVKSFKRGKADARAGGSTALNSKLYAFETRAKRLYEQFEETKKFPQPLVFKKKLLEDTITFEEERNFLSDFENFLAYSKNKSLSSSTIKNYKQGLKLLKNAANAEGHSLDYPTMDLNFYGKLKKYFLQTEGHGINYFGRCVKTLKTFLNYAKANGWNKYDYYKHKEFKILQEESPIVALTESELADLCALDLINRPRLALTNDYFILGCETGLRYSDFAKITKNRIKEVENGYNLDVKKTKKTGIEVVIPLSKLAFDTLLKYSFQMPPPPTNQKMNENLKTLTGLAEIEKNVTTHTARKTFATIQYRSGTPVAWIMKITGHRSEKEFYKYIGVDKDENADMVRTMHDKYKIGKKGLLNRNLKVVGK